MNNVNPFVSAILPVYNGGTFIFESINSILEQDYSPLEIVVIDDGSTDNTAEVVSTFGRDIKYKYQDNQGPAAARNAGLELSQGKLIAFLDVDDLWPPRKLHNQVQTLNTHPHLQIVMGKTLLFGDLDRLRNKKEFQKENFVVINSFLGCCVVHKAVFDIVGVFDEDLRYGEDLDWLLRAKDHRINIALINEVTLHYRVHANNTMRVAEISDLKLARFIKKTLDRRRQDNLQISNLPKFSQGIKFIENNADENHI